MARCKIFKLYGMSAGVNEMWELELPSVPRVGEWLEGSRSDHNYQADDYRVVRVVYPVATPSVVCVYVEEKRLEKTRKPSRRERLG